MKNSNKIHFKPLVSAATRTGLTLQVDIAKKLIPFSNNKNKERNINILRELSRFMGRYVESELVNTFAKAGIKDELLYNGLFRSLVGGTKWLKEDEIDKVCIRKYIGVKGMGDFTLITSHPRELLDIEEVVHSHVDPTRWFRDNYYDDYSRFASVRNPAGTINSAMFSINALTSEYIQKYVPSNKDNDEIRQNIAKSKLTNLEFVKSVQKYYTEYLNQLAEVKGKYILMRWEDLIQTPISVILKLAHSSGVEISRGDATNIWNEIDHKNLTGPHKHNYRKGKGKVNDWKNWLVNEHIELLKNEDIESVMGEFGYEKLNYFNEKFYTPFQHEISEYIRKGEVFKDIKDEELFGFSIQKSNVDWRDLKGFRGYEWQKNTVLERSCFSDSSLENEVWNNIETAIDFVNRKLNEVINLVKDKDSNINDYINDLVNEYSDRCSIKDSFYYRWKHFRLKQKIN